MIERKNFKEALKIMGFIANESESVLTFENNGIKMIADFSSGTLIYPEHVRGRNHNTSFDAPENFVVFECVHRLITKGYDPKDIHLEKEWKLGRIQKGGRADICVYDKGSEDILMIIECKTAGREYTKAFNDTTTDGGQLFSYWQQEISAKWLVLYTSNFDNGKIKYESPAINCTDDENLLKLRDRDETLRLYVNAHTAQEKFRAWDETYGKDFREDIIFSDESSAYDIGNRPILKKNLKAFTQESEKGIINRFEEILRHNNVSDKENAFNRLVALFICKLVDEYSKGNDDELDFQYVPRRDTYEKLQDRLQKLYHEGMSKFMREEITYIPAEYPQTFMKQYKGGDKENAIRELSEAFRKLKYFTNNDFAFLDVHNEALFYKNGKILVEVVQLFEHYRIVHTENHQLLGDLFEKLLDQGFRQNEGQFFTPIPLARFIWDSLPLKRYETWPKVIDYACGAGHFLTEAIEAVNHFIPSESREWVRDSIFGIEKDYRLARVSKVSMFMNGAGNSNILFADGLEDSGIIKRGTFDILTANPPYSVASFKQHLRFKSDDFRLWDSITPSSSEIEVLFVERIGQLLNDNGIAAVILPSSILSNDSQAYIGARQELLRTFKIRAIVKLGSKTFGATGTNTVILFLERYLHNPSRLGQALDSTDAILDRRDRNLELWEDIDILNGYLSMQGITREQWHDFVHERLTPETMPEYFRMYFEAYGENFCKQAKEAEYNKILYYAFTYCQRTTVIIAPSDNAGQREFLGYYWSYRKGDEGIHYDGERGGKMYVNSDREASGTLADVVRQSFGDGDIVMTEDNKRYARVVETWRMLDFSRVSFNAGMNLQPQGKITDMKGKTTLAKILDVITERTETANLIPSQYVTTETMLQNCKGIMTFTGDLPKGNVYSFRPGDILLSNIRPYLQKIWLADFEGGCSTNVFVFRSKDDTQYDTKYIFCMMSRKDFFDYVMLNTKGLNMPQGKREHILDYVIPLPPMEIQQKIANECNGIDSQESSLSAKIKTCREKIEDIFRELQSVTGRITLARVVGSVTDRINTSSLVPSQYVNTDTMLQKCEGIREYDRELPPGSVIRFQEGDILLSNIRPYLRKLWFADFEGGCSPDVLVFRSKDEEKFSGRYVYYAMRQEAFFDFVMQDVKGMKMPRGKREHILDYRIPAATQEQQKEFLDATNNLEAEISRALAGLKALEGKKEAVLRKYLQ